MAQRSASTRRGNDRHVTLYFSVTAAMDKKSSKEERWHAQQCVKQTCALRVTVALTTLDVRCTPPDVSQTRNTTSAHAADDRKLASLACAQDVRHAQCAGFISSNTHPGRLQLPEHPVTPPEPLLLRMQGPLPAAAAAAAAWRVALAAEWPAGGRMQEAAAGA